MVRTNIPVADYDVKFFGHLRSSIGTAVSRCAAGIHPSESCAFLAAIFETGTWSAKTGTVVLLLAYPRKTENIAAKAKTPSLSSRLHPSSLVLHIVY